MKLGRGLWSKWGAPLVLASVLAGLLMAPVLRILSANVADERL